MLENGLFELLSTTAAVTSAIAKAADGGYAIHFGRLPKQPALPAVVIHRVAGVPEAVTLDATSNLIRARLQIEIFAQDDTANPAAQAGYLSVATAAKAIRQLLQDENTLALPDGTQLRSVLVHDEFDANFEEGGVGYAFRRVLDLTMWYLES